MNEPTLALANVETYYGRIQCYGDMEMFQFTAAGSVGTTLPGTSVISGQAVVN